MDLEPAGVGIELLTHEAGIVTLGVRQIWGCDEGIGCDLQSLPMGIVTPQFHQVSNGSLTQLARVACF